MIKILFKNKYIISLMIVNYLLFSPLLQIARSASLDALNEQIKQKEEEIKKLEAEIATLKKNILQKQNEAKTLTNKLSILDNEIKKLTTEIKVNQLKLNNTNLKIENLNTQINDLENQIVLYKNYIKQALKKINENDQINIIELVFAEGNFSAILNQADNMKKLQEELKIRIDNIKKLKEEVSLNKKLVEEQKNELEELSYKLKAQYASLDYQRSEQNKILKITKGQQQRYQQILAENEKRKREIEQEINELEDIIRRQYDLSRIPRPRKGLFIWPSSESGITRGYGENGKYYERHNGLDIASDTLCDAYIYAAADGKVIKTGDSGKYYYGKWVVIEHDNGLTTLYGHLSSIIVSSGQSVKAGQIIGREGNTGYVEGITGCHLHFSIFAPRTFQIKKGIYDYLPIGVSLNPLDYL